MSIPVPELRALSLSGATGPCAAAGCEHGGSRGPGGPVARLARMLRRRLLTGSCGTRTCRAAGVDAAQWVPPSVHCCVRAPRAARTPPCQPSVVGRFTLQTQPPPGGALPQQPDSQAFTAPTTNPSLKAAFPLRISAAVCAHRAGSCRVASSTACLRPSGCPPAPARCAGGCIPHASQPSQRARREACTPHTVSARALEARASNPALPRTRPPGRVHQSGTVHRAPSAQILPPTPSGAGGRNTTRAAIAALANHHNREGGGQFSVHPLHPSKG